MRRFIVALATILAILPPSAPANAQAGCTFKLGFKALHDEIPDIVGNCKEDEHFEGNYSRPLVAGRQG